MNGRPSSGFPLAPLVAFVVVQLAIGISAIAPWAISAGAGALGQTLGCRVDESGVQPCYLFGADIGGVLYGAGMFGWLILASLPAAFVVWIAHTLYTLVRLVRWQRRRACSPDG
ncbi:hypothetical protein [Salinisphaera sp. T31B1]|uniref:hypothetical protein n=1 Tax=Salinisphaera sp. T31B1 TaxID=727963 RepID=UPI0033409767